MRAHGIAVLGVEPRVRRELLKPERYALFVAVELEDLDLNLIADVHQVAGMGQPSPGHVGNVQQSIDAAEVHECTVVGKVLHDSGENRSFLQMFQQLGLLCVLFRLEKLFARNYDVAALLVQLHDRNVEALPLVGFEIPHWTQI